MTRCFEQRYSDGYRLEIDVPVETRADAAAALADADRSIELTATGLRLSAAALDPAILAALRRVEAAYPGARIRIEQPQMTDIFRRVVAASGAAP